MCTAVWHSKAKTRERSIALSFSTIVFPLLLSLPQIPTHVRVGRRQETGRWIGIGLPRAGQPERMANGVALMGLKELGNAMVPQVCLAKGWLVAACVDLRVRVVVHAILISDALSGGIQDSATSYSLTHDQPTHLLTHQP